MIFSWLSVFYFHKMANGMPMHLKQPIKPVLAKILGFMIFIQTPKSGVLFPFLEKGTFKWNTLMHEYFVVINS